MDYQGFWQKYAGPLTLEHWVNDGLMAVFFLLIGLELERELYSGELSDLSNAILPIFAAIGGMAVPAIFHFSFNMGTPMQAGFGIPMATDIAFALHKPVAFIILPIFALANTGVLIGAGWLQDLTSTNGLGIAIGLIIGKPLGIVLFCKAAVACGACRLPADLHWQHMSGTGMLGGIGFTMSIFITNLAFAGNAKAINDSKMAILFASLSAGIAGFLWLRKTEKGMP